jgi:rod shape determining protein RodA
VLKQPDLGTSLAFVAITLGILVAAGAPGRILAPIVVAGLGSVIGAVVAHFRWGLPLPLEDYQLKRLIVFTNPGIDPLGSGYQLRQSIIAIGSGRLVGKGLFAGTQNQLRFLPFQHTDFIFSVIGEELGFIGGIAVLTLYLFVLWRGLRIAAMARDYFGALLSVGVVSMLAFHILINVGMTLGMMPVTGIPLPFMSYGGNSMITNMAAVGLLLNVYMRRHKIVF